MAPTQSKPKLKEELKAKGGTNGSAPQTRWQWLRWIGLFIPLVALIFGRACLLVDRPKPSTLGDESRRPDEEDARLDDAKEAEQSQPRTRRDRDKVAARQDVPQAKQAKTQSTSVAEQQSRIRKSQGEALYNRSIAPWFDAPVDLSPLARGRPHFKVCERLSSKEAADNPELILRRVYELGQPLILTGVIDGKRLSRKGGAALQRQLLRESGDVRVDVDVDWSSDFQRPTENGTLLNPASKMATLSEFFDMARSHEDALKQDGQPLREVYNVGQQPVSPEVLRALRLQQPAWMQALCGEAPIGSCGQLQLWVATHGKRSLLHFDKYENALLQVVGTKRLRLIDSLRMDSVYPSVVPREFITHHSFGSFGRYMQKPGEYGTDNFAVLRLDDENISSTFPRFDHEVVTHCVLEPGEMLLLPAYWWHDVLNEAPKSDALRLNIAVNFWFEPQRLGSMLMDGLTYNFFRLSHAWSELSHQEHPLIKEHGWKPPSALTECANGRPAFHSFDWTFVETKDSRQPPVVDGTLSELESIAIYTIVWLQSRAMLLSGQPPQHWGWPSKASSETVRAATLHAAPDDRFDFPHDGILRRALRAPLDSLPADLPHEWHSFVTKQPSVAMPPPLVRLMPQADASEEYGQGSAKFAWHYSPRVRAFLPLKGVLKVRLVDFVRSSGMQVERLREADLLPSGSLRITGRTVDNFSSCRSCAKISERIDLRPGMLLLVPSHWWVSLSISGSWKLVKWTSKTEHAFNSRVVEFLSEMQWAQSCHNISQ